MYWRYPAFLLLVFAVFTSLEWGFYAHREINRMAVFTLPPSMMPLFKSNIDYMAEHAVDPDKRRYAVKPEAVRHYIDLDHWGTLPFDDLPRTRFGALLKYSQLVVYRATADSLALVVDSSMMAEGTYRRFFRTHLLPAIYDPAEGISCDSVRLMIGFAGPCEEVRIYDRFSKHGILPFHLMVMQQRLTEAFRHRDRQRILQLAAEQGHYLADAHVPLHTTENYDGQLSGQKGIHAFWESRIPELFAEREFDYLVGKAKYIEDPPGFFWEVVLESHRLAGRVLTEHLRLRDSFPAGQQWCFELRGENTVRQPCTEFALAYRQSMEGMVERRMRQAIHAVGSSWYTAWVDAGQPDLWEMEVEQVDTSLLFSLEEHWPNLVPSRPHE